MLLPINNSSSAINHTYVFRLRLDYLFHALLFVPWMFLTPYEWFKKYSIIWFLTGLIFASMSESIQYFIPYRAFNINDLLANIMGVFIGVFLAALKKNKILQKFR